MDTEPNAGSLQDHQLYFNPSNPSQTLVVLKNIEHMNYLELSFDPNRTQKIFPNYYILDNLESTHKQKLILQAMLSQKTDPAIMISQFCKLARSCVLEEYANQAVNFLQDEFLKLEQKVQKHNSLDQIYYDTEKFRRVLCCYTRGTFFYKLLDRILKGGRDSTELYYAQYFISLMSKAITFFYKKQRQEQLSQVSGRFKCFRGAYFSEKQLEELQKNVGKDIQTLGFFSTSLIEQIAIQFATNALIQIDVHNVRRDEESHLGYALIREFSCYLYQQEVLFNVLSSFRIKSVEETVENGNKYKYWKIRLEYGVTYQITQKYKEEPIGHKNDFVQSEQVWRHLSYQTSFFRGINSQEKYFLVQNLTDPYIQLRKLKAQRRRDNSQLGSLGEKYEIHYNPEKPESTVMLKNINLMDYYNQQYTHVDQNGKEALKQFPNFYALTNLKEAHKQKAIISALLNQQTCPKIMIKVFCKLAQKCYPTSERDTKSFREDFLQKNVEDYDALRWYTEQTFFYKLINRLLRAGKDSTQLFYGQHFIKLLSKEITSVYLLQKQQKRMEVSGNFKCFRGAYFSQKQLNQLKKNVGKHIETLGFMSTTVEKSVAFAFLPNGNTLIEIEVFSDVPKDEELDLGYAYLGVGTCLSKKASQMEVLFNLLSSFRIKSVGKFDHNGTQISHITLEYGILYQIMQRYKDTEAINQSVEVQQEQILQLHSLKDLFKGISSQEECVLVQTPSEDYLRIREARINLQIKRPLNHHFYTKEYLRNFEKGLFDTKKSERQFSNNQFEQKEEKEFFIPDTDDENEDDEL